MKPENPKIVLKGALNPEDAKAVAALERACVQADGTAFKLELDYKLSAAAERAPGAAAWHMDELMAYDGDRLIGYLGAGFFGGEAPEAMGMVHPEYRRQRVFSALHRLAVADWRGRGVKRALLLSDRRSASGRAFVEKLGAAPHHSEYEMYLKEEPSLPGLPGPGISFRKAMNADAGEVARQNALYFGEERGDGDREPELILPEEEEAKGMAIHLAYWDGWIVGKVHLQLLNGLGGIYGLGVLPEYRGRGLGRAILLEGVRRLKAAGAGEVLLQVATGNESALGLYKSCGFKVTSTMDYYALNL